MFLSIDISVSARDKDTSSPSPTVNYRGNAHARNNAHPPKTPKYRSKILCLTYGRYNAHPLKIQFLNLEAHGRYGGRLRYVSISVANHILFIFCS